MVQILNPKISKTITTLQSVIQLSSKLINKNAILEQVFGHFKKGKIEEHSENKVGTEM